MKTTTATATATEITTTMTGPGTETRKANATACHDCSRPTRWGVEDRRRATWWIRAYCMRCWPLWRRDAHPAAPGDRYALLRLVRDEWDSPCWVDASPDDYREATSEPSSRL